MRHSSSLFASFAFVALLISACAPSSTTLRSPDVPASMVIRTPNESYTADFWNRSEAVSTEIPLPIERVWSGLPQVYDKLGLTRGGLVTPGSRMYGVRNKRIDRIAGKHMSEYLDCGYSVGAPRADLYDVRVTAITRLTEVDGGTHVETLVHASATPRGVSGNPITCASRATLEPLIAARLWAKAG
ncbi:MAG: hypothetical protein P8099_10365 [Gemmatimonadota bacterium]